MLESRWPKGPLIVLALLVPALILINPYVREAIRSARVADAVAATHGSPAAASQGPYVLRELDGLASRFWHRVAGRSTNLAPKVNGHDQFAASWLKQAEQNLKGLPIAVIDQTFPTPGFRGFPASRPGRNVIVMIPGSVDPRQAIVVAAHYDGDPASKGSAYDDTSGSAIMLGLSRVLGAEWRSRGLPSRTIELILFDGEEQWMVGSGVYVFDYRHRAVMPTPVMMLDEEQSGIAYPVHPFGLKRLGALPSYAITTAISPLVQEHFGPVSRPSQSALDLMQQRIKSAATEAFTELHGLYPKLRLRDGTIAPFGPREVSQLLVGPYSMCCSDNAPFEALGLPTATLTGDFTYYDSQHPPWAYPYDQPQDTTQALACDTGGSPAPTRTLAAALALPLMLSAQLLNDYSPPRKGSSIAVMGMPAIAGQGTRFTAAGRGRLRWSFGEGETAEGNSVSHTFRKMGTYVLRVTGSRASTAVRVLVQPSIPRFHAPFGVVSAPRVIPWHPAQLNGIRGCP